MRAFLAMLIACALMVLPGRAGADGMEESPDEILDKLRREEREEDFGQVMDNMFPVSVEEFLKAKRKSEMMEQVINPKPARMRTESRELHVTPGAAPQVVRLTGGYSSTIVFQDSTGAPWPVLSMVLGAPSAFSATQPVIERPVVNEGETGNREAARNVASNLINLVPLTQRASSNLVVNLEDCPYPVVIHLLTESSMKGKRSADALIVFRLDKAGPNATQPALGPGITDAITPDLLGFVHGVPPAGAKMLDIEPALPGTRIWKHGDKLFLRTVHPLVWPAWQGSAGSEDVKVYILPPTQSAVVSVDGAQTAIRIRGGK